ncbi:hypothetical protein ElyMa_005135200 [Elysia marginata]|uniref:Uncharacterized protein n=1 Tax=Elysia marginata TaxID=1093978 RepID=A0AAV4JP67_9GAST|nr:hypothetical protein ElyMa_005135200 [Elysia marginata]
MVEEVKVRGEVSRVNFRFLATPARRPGLSELLPGQSLQSATLAEVGDTTVVKLSQPPRVGGVLLLVVVVVVVIVVVVVEVIVVVVVVVVIIMIIIITMVVKN